MTCLSTKNMSSNKHLGYNNLGSTPTYLCMSTMFHYNQNQFLVPRMRDYCCQRLPLLKHHPPPLQDSNKEHLILWKTKTSRYTQQLG